MISNRQRYLRLAGGVAAGLVLIVLIFWWSRPVAKVARVKAGVALNAVPGSVAVQAEYTMEVKSEIGGRVLVCNLSPGATVKTGDVLIQLDAADVKLEIERITSDYEAAKKRIQLGSQLIAELANAREDLQNAERANKLGSMSDSDLNRTRRQLQAIEQKIALEEVNNKQLLENYENTLKVKRRQLSKMTVIAPFDGVVSYVDVDARKGALMGGGSIVAKVIANSRTVTAKISEENFAGVRVGQKATVRFLPYGPEMFEAKVTQILPTADPGTQRYVVYLEVKIAPERLRPDITGEVTIVVDEHPSDTLIPRRALFGNSVYAVKDGRVQLRPVAIGFISLTTVEIREGVASGELVIVDKLDQFRAGDRVRTVEVGSLK